MTATDVRDAEGNKIALGVLRYVAFSTSPAGGNPAGVVLDARGVDAVLMAKIATQVGFSETAFVSPRDDGALDVRYFSPGGEVSFCGHATVAAAVAHAELHGPGELDLHTKAGLVTVTTSLDAQGRLSATFVSVPPRTAPIKPADLDALLDALHWPAADLDTSLPPILAYAGAWHPVIAAATRARLADLAYDMPRLEALMRLRGWATVNLVWRESSTIYYSRNPFPPGGVVEDPATGAAAAALGGLLRSYERAAPGATVTIHQGADMGRPSTITVTLPLDPNAGVAVSGAAVRM